MYQYKTSYPVFAPIASEGAAAAPTYGEGAFLGEAMVIGMTPQFNSASLYGDDKAVANVTAFKQLDLSLQTTTLPLAAFTAMFGATHTEAQPDSVKEKVSEKTTDTAKYGGLGFITGGLSGNAEEYHLFWIPKVKFTPPAETYNTNGESIAFGTPTVTGMAIADNTGEWRYRDVYATLADALEALKTTAQIEE